MYNFNSLFFLLLELILKEIFIKTEYIKLGQFVKFINLISNGSDIKSFLHQNTIQVNGEIENRRGRKLFSGDQVKILGLTYLIKNN